MFYSVSKQHTSRGPNVQTHEHVGRGAFPIHTIANGFTSIFKSVCVCVYATTYVWKSENTLWELGLSIMRDPGIELRMASSLSTERDFLPANLFLFETGSRCVALTDLNPQGVPASACEHRDERCVDHAWPNSI